MNRSGFAIHMACIRTLNLKVSCHIGEFLFTYDDHPRICESANHNGITPADAQCAWLFDNSLRAALS